MKVLLLSVLLALTVSLTCSSDKVYVSVRKVCTSDAGEDKWNIKTGTTTLVASASYSYNEDRTNEYCLAASTNNQYTIELIDTYGDFWYQGAYIEVKGINDRIVFKQTIHHIRMDTYPLSLYAPINKSPSEVKYSSSSTLANTWNTVAFSDSDWTSVTLGSTSSIQPTTGTQYFRKAFTGVGDLAAYELALYYQYGVIAYLDGTEIYRDNMPDGEPNHSTSASGSYSSLGYHNAVRNGNEISSGNHVLAVRVHFTSTSSQPVTLNMYLGQYAKSFSKEEDPNCWAIAESPDLTSPVPSSYPDRGLNWNRGDFWSVSSSYLSSGAALNMKFSEAKYLINGFEIFPTSTPSSSPRAFSLSGATDATTSATYTQFYSVSNMVYDVNEYATEKIDFAVDLLSQLKLTVTATGTSYLYLYEFHPAVCNIAPPTSFSYPQQEVYVTYSTIEAKPSVTGISQCTSVNLPEGLSVDFNTCVVTGLVASTTLSGTYSITAAHPSTIPGTITIVATECTGNPFRLETVYGSGRPFFDYFTVYDADSNTVVYDEPSRSVQMPLVTLSHFFCTNANRLKISMGSSSGSWISTSMLYVYSTIADDEEELILKTRLDNFLGNNPTTYVSIKQHVRANSMWKYSFPATAPAANWYTGASSWTSENKRGSFPNASNQYQLYGKTFDVSAAELANTNGFVLNLRFKYGVLVYLNGHEVFRNQVSSTATDITQMSSATKYYSTVLYRQVSLPTKFMSSDPAAPGAQLLQSGSNTIAIALIANSASTVTSDFDCTVRLLGSTESNRILDYTASMSNMYGSANNAFDMYYGTYLYYSSCATTNYLQLTYKDDRREWISSIVLTNYYSSTTLLDSPKVFQFQAKNPEDSTWTTLFEAKGDLYWWVKNQHKKIYFFNNKAYNMYRLYNIGTGDSTSAATCTYRFTELDFIADKIDVEVPNLTYTPQSTSGYKDIEFAEWYPDQTTHYSSFSVNPNLPAGLTIDPASGIVIGTPTTTVAPSNYVVSAKKIDGTPQSFTISIGVTVCTGGKSLVTFVMRTDGTPSTQGYKVYTGKTVPTTGGNEYAQKLGFPVSSSMYYFDNCYDHDTYTVRFYRTTNGGWSWPSSYTIAVDQSGLRMDLGYVTSSSTSPSYTDSTFSSNLPWQIEYSDWKVLYLSVPEDMMKWKQVDFDDNNWNVMKMAQLAGTTIHQTTVYIRQAFTISTAEEYPVMNIRARYNGGFIAYLNGNRIARFNLQDRVSSDTEAYSTHNEDVFSKFHAILLTQGGVDGKNIFAVEHHRAAGVSSAVPHIFDSTAIFGLNSCSLLSDSIVNIEAIDDAVTPSGSWTPTTGAVADMFDHDPTSQCYYRNTAKTVVQWEVENLEKSRWNSYFIATASAYNNYGWSFSGRHTTDGEWNAIDIRSQYNTKSRVKNSIDSSIGMAGFKYYRFHLDVAGSGIMQIGEFGFQYCTVEGTGICRGNIEYPTVADGESSPGECGEGFTGYTTRKCSGGALSPEVDRTHCIYKPPVDLAYEHDDYTFILDTEILISPPTFGNLITKFRVDENHPLPDGLSIDETTGEIFGKPEEEQKKRKYTVYGENPSGTITTEISIQIKKGTCEPDGIFRGVEVGTTFVYSCSEKGNYIGTITRECRLGKVNGEWQKEKGSCTSVMLIVFLVILAIVVVIVVASILRRSVKKTKVVGGARRASPNSNRSVGSSSSKNPSSKKTVKV